MLILQKIAQLSMQRSAWLLLFISTFGLEVAALYFQYVMDLKPCIMCIYQRTAVFGIMFSTLPVIILNNFVTRLLAFLGWGVSAIWGLIIAIEHVDIQTAANPFFATCEIVPNFPSWLPLHQWLPNIFAASGDCGDINWSFFNMTMPEWMIVIFSIYSMLWALVIISRMLGRKEN
jgi:disulfide bond formation protein DsbB